MSRRDVCLGEIQSADGHAACGKCYIYIYGYIYVGRFNLQRDMQRVVLYIYVYGYIYVGRFNLQTDMQRVVIVLYIYILLHALKGYIYGYIYVGREPVWPSGKALGW